MRDELSPDGEIELTYNCFELRMSHWVCPPRLRRIEDDTVLVDFWKPESMWDASEREFDAPGQITFQFREYPGREPAIPIRVDYREGTFRIDDERRPAFLIEQLTRSLREVPRLPG